MDRPSVGFIGVGLMGGPMVLRLCKAGVVPVVWNRSPAKLALLRDAGVVVASSPREVAARSEIVALCLTDIHAVEAVLFGPDGAVTAPPSKLRLVVDFSSIAPQDAKQIAARLAERGVGYVDAPVSGGVQGATDGTLIVMCGGAPENVAQAQLLFAPLSSKVTHLGPVGAGQVAKLCNQLLCAATILAASEAVALGRRAGIDVRCLPDALAGGLADSGAFRLWGGRMARESWSPNIGPVRTMQKDVINLLATARAAALDLPLSQSIGEIFVSLIADGRAGDDLGSLASRFE